MEKKETLTRVIRPVVDILKEARAEEGAQEQLRELLDEEQLRILDALIEGTLPLEERWIAYLKGYKASEIAKEIGLTRATVTSRITHQLGDKKESAKKEHGEKRKRLYAAREWYLYVYLSDKVGDYRQMAQYLPERLREDVSMYRIYEKNGGRELERDFVDRRHEVSPERKHSILTGLQTMPLEEVAFKERVYPTNVVRIAEESGQAYTTEEELGRTEYTDKLEIWMKRKQLFNDMQVQRRRMQREKEEKEEDEN